MSTEFSWLDVNDNIKLMQNYIRTEMGIIRLAISIIQKKNRLDWN